MLKSILASWVVISFSPSAADENQLTATRLGSYDTEARCEREIDMTTRFAYDMGLDAPFMICAKMKGGKDGDTLETPIELPFDLSLLMEN